MRCGGPKGGLQDFGSVAMVTSLLMGRGDNCHLLLQHLWQLPTIPVKKCISGGLNQDHL